MHDIIARSKRGERLDRCAGRVFARAANAALTPEDFVIGENAQAFVLHSPRRDDEPAMQHSDRKLRSASRPAFAKKLFQALCLSSVVAKDQRWNSVRHHLAEPLHVAEDRFRFGYREIEPDRGHAGRGKLRVNVRDLTGNSSIIPSAPIPWSVSSECDRARCAPARLHRVSGEIDVMLSLSRSPELGGNSAVLRYDHYRIRCEQRQDRDPLGLLAPRSDSSVDRQISARSASRVDRDHEVEVPELGNLITPELQPHRFGHSEAVDVEDSAPNAELRDIVHHRNAFEPDGLEVGNEIFGTPYVAFSDLQAGLGERARQLRFLQQRASGGQEYAHLSTPDALECFNTLAGYLSA